MRLHRCRRRRRQLMRPSKSKFQRFPKKHKTQSKPFNHSALFACYCLLLTTVPVSVATMSNGAELRFFFSDDDGFGYRGKPHGAALIAAKLTEKTSAMRGNIWLKSRHCRCRVSAVGRHWVLDHHQKRKFHKIASTSIRGGAFQPFL